jgi:hypothetical protein
VAKAICIITSTGLKCLSSPVKEHRPGAHACRLAPADPARTAKIALLRRALRDEAMGLSRTQENVIAKVVELLLAARVDGDSRFTIVKAG